MIRCRLTYLLFLMNQLIVTMYKICAFVCRSKISLDILNEFLLDDTLRH